MGAHRICAQNPARVSKLCTRRAPYASSKAGVLNLTKVLALEWAAKGVTCNTICPGPFATDMNTIAKGLDRMQHAIAALR